MARKKLSPVEKWQALSPARRREVLARVYTVSRISPKKWQPGFMLAIEVLMMLAPFSLEDELRASYMPPRKKGKRPSL